MINLAISLAVYLAVVGLLQVTVSLDTWINALIGLAVFALFISC